jgi:hypothetical protein
MKTLLALIFLTASVTIASGAAVQTVPELPTLLGRTYRDCHIKQIHPDGVSFTHASGAAKVLYSDLPDTWKKKLGYNEKRAKAYEDERTMRQFLEQERVLKSRADQAERQRQEMDIRLRILGQTALIQERQFAIQQQQLAAAYGFGYGAITPAPAVGWPGTYYGPLNTIHGPRFGGRPWLNRGSISLASVGGGSGGYLGRGHPGLRWVAHGQVWHTSPTLGSYIPGRFAPLGSSGPFGGVYLGGARNLGFHGIGQGFGAGAAACAPVLFRGSVSIPAP